MFYDNTTKEPFITLIFNQDEKGIHITLSNQIRDRLITIGIPKYNIPEYGSTRTQEISSSGQGDSGTKLLPERRGNNRIATLIVECGYTQKLSSLRSACRWWLMAHEHEQPSEHCRIGID